MIGKSGGTIMQIGDSNCEGNRVKSECWAAMKREKSMNCVIAGWYQKGAIDRVLVSAHDKCNISMNCVVRESTDSIH